MPSNDATLNHEHERARRYAHQSASGNPDYNIVRDERGVGCFDGLHLPTGDTFRRYKGEDEGSQTSRHRQRLGEETPVSNGDLTHCQYDGCYDSLDPMQRLMEAHYSGRGEDGHRKNWLDANPEPRGSDVIHCTHSENERCTGYLWCLSRKKGPFEEGMTCIGKEEKWKRGWHGPYDDELPDHNKWGCGQANLMKADRRSERDQYGTFCSHKSDKFCTRPSWCLSREDWLFKPGGSDSHGGDGFPDGLPNEHKDALQQQYGNYYGNYYMRNTGSGWGLLRGGHGDDVEHQSSPPEPYQPTVEDAPDVNAYLDRFEQGRSSQAAEDRQQSTDDGLGRFRAMHANSRAEDEEAEARFKMYLEATRQDHRRLEEAKAVERVLCQKRADLERCDAQRATTETRPQAEQVPVQPYEDRGGKGKARAATNDNAHPREEASLLEQVAGNPKTNAAPQAENGGRNLMDEGIPFRLLPLPLLPLPPQGHLQWREAERNRIEARLRAAQQAADEAHVTLLTHEDPLDAEIAMFDPFPDLEGMILEGHVHRAPGDFRPAFLPMPPLWPGDIAAERWPYPGRDFPSRPSYDFWTRRQPYSFPWAEAGQLDDLGAGLPYPPRPPPRPYYQDHGWAEEMQHLNEEMKRLKQEHECLEEANDRLKEGTERLIRETGRLNEEETRGLNRLEDEQSPTIQ